MLNATDEKSTEMVDIATVCFDQFTINTVNSGRQRQRLKNIQVFSSLVELSTEEYL